VRGQGLACAKDARHQASRARDLRGTGKNYKSQAETLCRGSDFEDLKLRIEDFLPPRTRSKKV
jgi:hypothetical protein